MPHFLHLGDKKKQTEIRTGKVHCSSSLYYSFSPIFSYFKIIFVTKPQRCEGPDSWAWKCREQSACSPHDQSPAPPASSVALLSSEPPSSWSPQSCRDQQHAGLYTWQTGSKHSYLSNLQIYSLFGFFIPPYFGISLGALQLSLGIRKLVPFSINLRSDSD